MNKTIFDQFELPPVARLLGWTLRHLDSDKGTIEVQFEAKEAFSNHSGNIQGGILTAMLDDTLGPAIVGHTNGQYIGRTIDLHVHFLRPVLPGLIRTSASIRKFGRTVAFVDAELYDQDGKLAATGTASMSLAPLQKSDETI